jgi:hypothetical protein
MIVGSILSVFLIFVPRDRSHLRSKFGKRSMVLNEKTKQAAFSFRTRKISHTDYPHDFPPEVSFYDIARLHYQMLLLKYLESVHISEVDKLHEIEGAPHLLSNDSKYVTNLFAGGLLDVW